MKNYTFKTEKAEIVSAARLPQKTWIHAVLVLMSSNVIIQAIITFN